MATMLQKGMIAFAGIAVIGGGIAGAALASFAQNGAFEFYKQTPPPAEGGAAAAPASDSYYPVASPAPTYPENPYPPRPLMIARPAAPIDYQRAEQIEPEPVLADEEAILPEPAPVIVPRRGSWTAPAEEKALPGTDPATNEGAF